MAEKKEQETLWKSDPERYAKCSQPFANPEDANAAIEAFFADISALREKHLIADVEVIVKDSMGDGEDVGAFMAAAHFGHAGARDDAGLCVGPSTERSRSTNRSIARWQTLCAEKGTLNCLSIYNLTSTRADVLT